MSCRRPEPGRHIRRQRFDGAPGKAAKSLQASGGLGFANQGHRGRAAPMSHPAFIDLETSLFAADATINVRRSIAYASARLPRSPRPATLKPVPFLPRPPEWRRFPNGVGFEAVLVRARSADTETAIPQAA
jgi:hypothetical protein